MDLSALNDDVLTEILLRLPTKTLIRFKSVCKKWLSLISSDYFSHQHTLRGPKKPQPSLIVQHLGHTSDPKIFYWKPTLSMNGENVMIPYTLSVSLPHHDYQIMQACNGLLLLMGLDLDCRRPVYRVYNPTTRLSTEITPTYHDMFRNIAAMSLAFDPSQSPYYKVVCVTCPSSAFRKGDKHTYRVEVYDSESRSWKLSFGPFTLGLIFSQSRFDWCEAQYWNNAIYWWRPDDAFLCCIDIANREMKRISFPRPRSLLGMPHYLQELDGRLYYLRLSFGGSFEPMVAVWELVVGGDGKLEWLLRHDRVFASQGLGDFVQLMGGSDENLVVLMHHRSRKMKAYSFLHNNCEELVDFTAQLFDYKVLPFGETLALV